MFAKIAQYLRANSVMVVAAIAAFLSACVVPPDAAYASYIDFATLSCLFALLTVVASLRNAGAFEAIARLHGHIVTGERGTVLSLVLTTLVLSMFATNDMALILMLPLATVVLLFSKRARLLPLTFTLQNLAANLGGMILPFGNPQNLFLYQRYEIDFAAFITTMARPFVVSVALIVACCILIVRKGDADGSQARTAATRGESGLNRRNAICCTLLFALVVTSVLRLVPFYISLAVVLATLAVIDRPALRHADWGLLVTFACFFVFAGNLARIPALQGVLGGFMATDPLLCAATTSQVISNVPAALLLSHFTQDWPALLVGVNIGGAGTPIASLASLITLREFSKARASMSVLPGFPERLVPSTGRFALLFCLLNVGFLAVLLLACHL